MELDGYRIFILDSIAQDVLETLISWIIRWNRMLGSNDAKCTYTESSCETEI